MPQSVPRHAASSLQPRWRACLRTSLRPTSFEQRSRSSTRTNNPHSWLSLAIAVDRRDELERSLRQATAAAAAATAAKARLEQESKAEAARDAEPMPAIMTAIDNATPAIFLETAASVADDLIEALAAHDARRDLLARIADGFRRALDDAEGEERNRQQEVFADKLRRDAAEASTWGDRVPLERTAPQPTERPIDSRLLAARTNYAAALAQLERVSAALNAPATDEIRARNAAALAEFARDLESDAFVSLESR
jgi:hypothetical protein